MYTIFVNDKPIILASEPKTDLGLEIYSFNEIRVEEVVHKLRYSKTKGVCLYQKEVNTLFTIFKQEFEVVNAAGGLVVKNEREILCIFRNKRWDLPKGKTEEGESSEQSALREVEEECGINKLHIVKPLQTTYHIFREHNRDKLKITNWFLMHTTDTSLPKPQREEGITLAQYIPIQTIPDLYPTMYANISLLIQNFLN